MNGSLSVHSFKTDLVGPKSLFFSGFPTQRPGSCRSLPSSEQVAGAGNCRAPADWLSDNLEAVSWPKTNECSWESICRNSKQHSGRNFHIFHFSLAVFMFTSSVQKQVPHRAIPRPVSLADLEASHHNHIRLRALQRVAWGLCIRTMY